MYGTLFMNFPFLKHKTKQKLKGFNPHSFKRNFKNIKKCKIMVFYSSIWKVFKAWFTLFSLRSTNSLLRTHLFIFHSLLSRRLFPFWKSFIKWISQYVHTSTCTLIVFIMLIYFPHSSYIDKLQYFVRQIILLWVMKLSKVD